MKDMNLAGNRVLSHLISPDELIQYKLRVHGYEKFDELMNTSLSVNVNYFRTPTSITDPQAGPGYQYEPNNDAVKKLFSDYTCNILNNFFNSNLVVKDLWYLYQTNDSWINNPVHTHMTAEWIAVLYLDVSEGDTIQFYDADNNMEDYSPVFGELLFFPSTALHKPGPNTSSKRLTLNAELGRAELPAEEIETIRNRTSICNACDRLNVQTHICSECSCYIPMKVCKMESACPINKW